MRRRSQAAFTLVEMLVALMLLSLVMLGLSSALRSFAQAETRIDRRVLRSEAMYELNGFLRQIMGWVSGARLPGQEGQKPRVALQGRSNELAWLGVMPARHGVGGLHYLHLGLERRPQGTSLVLRYVPIKEKLAMPDWTTAQSIDLAEGIEEIQFQYMAEGKDEWLSDWAAVDKLPRLMRLNIQGGGAWPTLVVRVSEASEEGAGSQIVIGGGG